MSACGNNLNRKRLIDFLVLDFQQMITKNYIAFDRNSVFWMVKLHRNVLLSSKKVGPSSHFHLIWHDYRYELLLINFPFSYFDLVMSISRKTGCEKMMHTFSIPQE